MTKLTTLKPRIQSLHQSSGECTGWADQRRGSRHQRGYGTEWDRKRKQVLQRDASLCQPHLRIGVTVPGCREVDHIVNKARGGGDGEANLQTICRACHAAKTAAEARGMDWCGPGAIADPGSI